MPCVITEIVLGITEKHLEDKAVSGRSQHEFRKGKSCLRNLISFYDQVTHLADQEKQVGLHFLAKLSAKLSILFFMAFFWAKFPACSLTKNPMEWVNTWPMGQVQRVTLMGLYQTGPALTVGEGRVPSALRCGALPPALSFGQVWVQRN